MTAPHGAGRPAQPPRLRCRTIPLDRDPGDLLAAGGAAGFAWKGQAGELGGVGVAARVPVGTGPGRLERAAAAVAALLRAADLDDPEGSGLGPLAVGALPFDAGRPGALTVPALLLRRGPDGGCWATATSAGDPPPAAALPAMAREALRAPRIGPGDGAGWPAARRADPPGEREAFQRGVRVALAEIAAGRLDKVVLARRAAAVAEWPFPRPALLARLRDRAAGGYLYASGRFVGASPELLVARSGRAASSRPMAGTAPRGAGSRADAEALARLAGSAKDASEHRMVVDAVAGGLAKVADRVEVTAPEPVRLATVAHLASEVTATLSEPAPSALELAGLLHPTPAVAGAPRDAALAAIAACEPFDRGAYAGPVGWVDAAGDGEWAVALRCALLAGRGARANLLAGAGIVAGSDPAAEWEESEHKLRAVLDVLLGGAGAS